MYEDLRAVQSVQYLQLFKSRHDSIEQIRNRQMGKSDDRLTDIVSCTDLGSHIKSHSLLIRYFPSIGLWNQFLVADMRLYT